MKPAISVLGDVPRKVLSGIGMFCVYLACCRLFFLVGDAPAEQQCKHERTAPFYLHFSPMQHRE